MPHEDNKQMKLFLYTGEVSAQCTLSGRHLWESWLEIPIPHAAHEVVSSGIPQTSSEILQNALQFECCLEQPLGKK
jgi:hypothetical protein